MNKLSKKHSEVKIARVDRRHVNASTWHNVVRKAFNKAARKAAKLHLKEVVA